MARAMKDSGIDWIGSIPENWTISRTKYYYTNHKYVVGDKSAEYERLALTLNGVIKRPKDDSTGLQPEEFSGYQILSTDELVFKLIDLQNISTSRVGLSPYTGIVSPAYIILHKKEGVDAKYGEYFFLSMWQREIFNQMGDDGVRSSLNASDLLNIPYTYPPLAEQKKIAAFLDKQCSEIDEVLTKTRESIKEYKLLKNAIITQAVTKGIRSNRKMKDSGIEWIGEIPEEWNTIKLKYVCEYNKESLGEDTPTDYLFDYIDIGSVVNGEGITNYERMKFEDSPSRARRIVSEKNIILSTVRTYLKAAAIIPKHDLPLIVSTGFIVLAAKKEINSNYLFYAILADYFIDLVEAKSVGISYPAINSSEIVNFKITFPALTEQQEIADYLEKKCSEIDSLILKKEQLITELETYKKSLIYEYVTGKKEVQ